MDYTFKQIKLFDAERLWLTEIYKANFSPVNIRSMKIRLWDELPKDFDPKTIDWRLIRDNRLTLIGLWHVDPNSPFFSHVLKTIEFTRNLIRKNLEIKGVTAKEISDSVGISEREAEIVLLLILDLYGFFCGAFRSKDHYGYRKAIFGEDDSAYDKFLRFENLEREMEEFYVSSPKSVQLVPAEDSGELLQKQIEFNYMNFDRRRSYEWKLSLALWTAITAFIALTLRGEIEMETINWAIGVVIFFVCAVILILQGYFLVMTFKASDIDKKKSWYYEKGLNALIDTDWEKLTDINSMKLRNEIQNYKNLKPRFGGYWSCVVHVGITFILLFGAVCVLRMKTHTQRPPSTVYKFGLSLEKHTTTDAK